MNENKSEQLESMIDQSAEQAIERLLHSLAGTEIARAISQLPREKQNQLLEVLQPAEAADVVEQLSDTQAAQIVGRLQPETAAAIVHELPSNEQADLVGDLSTGKAAAILAHLESDEALQLKHLVQYPGNVAGGLMITEMLVYPEHWTVAGLLDDFRQKADYYRDFQVQYAFVINSRKELVGVLRLRDLLLAKSDQTVGQLMLDKPISVNEWASLDELKQVFDEHHFLGVPVNATNGRLLGLVTRVAVEEAIGQRADQDYLKTQGIVREELRSMPTLTRSRRRLAWLSINIVLNIMAASVIAIYQETLTQVIALAVFLPIISDMSGCSGNQAIAVSMRELSLGLARPTDVFRVWLKEITVGLIVGMSLGALIAVVAIAWQGNFVLGLVVGAALSINTLISVSIGGTLPLLMKRFKMDPALASGPVLTTVTDMCGFLLVLSLASAMLPWLTG
jgi:magnesium transporter